MIGLFFGGKAFKAGFGNDYGNIELDANLEETHDWSAEATESPVEEGSPISDHVIEQPDKLTLRGFISETPTTLMPQILGIIGKSDASSRTQEVFDVLRALIKQRVPVVVYTKHLTYPAMVITGLRIPRTPADGKSFEFVADFKSIRMVAAQDVDVPVGISAKGATKDAETARKTQPAKDAGQKSATPAASPAKPTSFLSGLLNG